MYKNVKDRIAVAVAVAVETFRLLDSMETVVTPLCARLMIVQRPEDYSASVW